MKPDADIEMYKLDTGEEMMVEKESYLLYDDSRFLGMLYEWREYMDLYDCLDDELCDNIDKNNEESRNYLPTMERQRNILLANI